MRLKGQVALVTGGGTGIGQGISLAFAREGASVAVNYQKSKDKAEATVRQIRESGGQAIALQADVRREADCKRLVDEDGARVGAARRAREQRGLDDAGGARRPRGPDRRDLAEGARHERDGRLVLHQARRARHARPGRGVIINITSVAAFSGKGSSLAYAASKAALGSMTRSLARPWARDPGEQRWPRAGGDGLRGVAAERVRGGPPRGSPRRSCRRRRTAARRRSSSPAEARATTGTTIFVDGGVIRSSPARPAAGRAVPARRRRRPAPRADEARRLDFSV